MGFSPMAAKKQDINDFRKRVKRIKSPRNDSYYDQDVGMHIPKRVPRSMIKKPKQAEEDSLLAKFIVSVVIGAFCVAVAQLIRVRYFGLIESGTITMAVDFMMTAWVLLTVTALLQRNQIGARLSQMIGVVAMLVAGHNLFWRWPEQMAYIYTADYANYVQQTTQAPSVLVGATVYTF